MFSFMFCDGCFDVTVTPEINSYPINLFLFHSVKMQMDMLHLRQVSFNVFVK